LRRPISCIINSAVIASDDALEGKIPMTVEIPSDLAPFVERMISQRRFLSEADVLAEGLRMLQARESLRDEVRKGFDQLDAGEGIAAEEVYAKAEQIIQDIDAE